MKRYCGRRCIAPNCRSGYDSNPEKCHSFGVPFDQNVVAIWQKAIPRKDFILKSGMKVCQKHFLPEDIVWRREVLDPDGNVMASEDLIKPRLKKGVVPSQFPNSPHISKTVRKMKPPKERTAPIKSKKPEPKQIKIEAELDPMDIVMNVYENLESNGSLNLHRNPHSQENISPEEKSPLQKNLPSQEKPRPQEKSPLQENLSSREKSRSQENLPLENKPHVQKKSHPQKKSSLHKDSHSQKESPFQQNSPFQGNLSSQRNPQSQNNPRKETADREFDERIDLFNSLFYKEGSIFLPKSWSRVQSEEGFPGMALIHSKSRMINGEHEFVFDKQINICMDMQIKFEVNGMFLPVVSLGMTDNHVSSIVELEKLIWDFDGLKICSGCASVNPDRNVENSSTIRDSSGHLRHRECLLVFSTKTKRISCERCVRWKKAVATKFVRIQKKAKHRSRALDVRSAQE